MTNVLRPGHWRTRGDEAWRRELAPVLEAARERGASENGRLTVSGVTTRFKHSRLSGRSSLRHAGRALLPRLDVPRLQEFRNLEWLRAEGFGAPRPLLAGVFVAGGLPRFQSLFTEEVPESRTLRELATAGDSCPDTLAEVGREVGRLHAAGFVHRDLYPRNLLVTHEDGAARIHFLDAWRGGPGPGLRGPAYDLACLLLFAPELFLPERFGGEELEALFAAYAAERRMSAARWSTLLANALRQRRRLAASFARRRRPGSPLHAPPVAWEPPAEIPGKRRVPSAGGGMSAAER